MSSHRSKSDPAAPFNIVLERLIERGGAPNGAVPGWRPAPACDWTPLVDVAAPAASVAATDWMYVDADTPASMPQGTLPSVEEAVARELQLSDTLEPTELERIRRRFAYRHHPDRVGPAHRDGAQLRMTIANVLIDQALAAARARATLRLRPSDSI